MLDKTLSFISKRFWIFFVVAIVLGLVLPDVFWPLESLLGVLMFGIMFLSGLTVKLKDMKTIILKPWKIILFVVFSMVLAPIIFYFAVKLIDPQWAIAVLLLVAAPTWIAAAALCSIVKGNTGFTLASSVVTSVIAPLTIPLLVKFLVGTEVAFDLGYMMLSMSLYIVLPLVIAQVLIYFLPKVVEKYSKFYGPLIILFVMPMIAWPLGNNASEIFSMDLWDLVLINILLFVISGLLHSMGWFVFWKAKLVDKISGSISLGYMNLSLATVLAAQYFGPEVLIVVVLFELPWDLMLIPFAWVVKKVRKCEKIIIKT